MIRIGRSGWNYRSWREAFYARLARRALRVGLLEVNTTFYRLAQRSAVERWVSQTPPELCFAVKASRYLTHMKRLTDLDHGVVSPVRAGGAAGRR